MHKSGNLSRIKCWLWTRTWTWWSDVTKRRRCQAHSVSQLYAVLARGPSCVDAVKYASARPPGGSQRLMDSWALRILIFLTLYSPEVPRAMIGKIWNNNDKNKNKNKNKTLNKNWKLNTIKNKTEFYKYTRVYTFYFRIG